MAGAAGRNGEGRAGIVLVLVLLLVLVHEFQRAARLPHVNEYEYKHENDLSRPSVLLELRPILRITSHSMSTKTRELARRWFEEIWNEHKVETIDELAHPDCICHHEGQATTYGVDTFKTFRNQLLGMLPDLKIEIQDIVSDETTAVVRWHFTGISWMKFSGSQVIEGWDAWNQAAFLQQISS